MLKTIDWQMVLFVAGSFIQDYGPHIHVPKIYYWDSRERKIADKGNKIA